LLETYRECLRDVFDLPGLVSLFQKMEQRQIRVKTVDVRGPSPFAASLLFSFAANFIYDGDAPIAERRAQALTIDQAQLRELLGETELRRLLDPDVIVEHERLLQHKTRPVKHRDGLHDLLLSLGDLSLRELEERSAKPEDVSSWVADLVRARRIYEAEVGGERRFLAIEDAGKLRDGLGIVPPRGTPDAFLNPSRDPVGDLVSRYARTHVPFTAEVVAARFGMSIGTVSLALEALVERGKVEAGEFLPNGTSTELCDVEVLRALRQKSLARLRRAVEPVDDEAYARLLIDWQLAPRAGEDGLLDAIRQLEGCPLPVSVLEREILPARIPGYRPWDLDHLCTRGEVVWGGIEPLGSHDGRVALYTSEHEALLARAVVPVDGAAAEAIRDLLSRRGAVFFPEIARSLGGFPGDAVDVLWEMVWAGEVTNDTIEPLRGLLRSKDPRGERVRGSARRAHGASPGVEGRWSLRAQRRLAEPSETEKRAALARSLLARYGLVTREGVHAEMVPGGFAAVYDVYKAMEEAGRIRRGYFVGGHGATQFALPGADDRLRMLRDPADPPRTRILSALDPASPYGASVAWPTPPSAGGDAAADVAHPQRVAGALVILYEGILLGWLGRSGSTLLTFGTDAPVLVASLANALGGLVETGRRRALLLTTIDALPAARSPHVPAFKAAGFTLGTRGLLRRRSEASFLAPAAVIGRP
jgi:ATP-dependent Lhr-like helicase